MQADLIEWGTSDGPRRSVADRLTPGSRRQAHRYAIGLFVGAGLLALAAELLPWMTITVPAALLDPNLLDAGDQTTVARLAGSYHLAQLSLTQSLAYSVTWLILAVLAAAALVAAPGARRVLSTAALGAAFGQLMVLTTISVAARGGGDIVSNYRVVLSTSRLSAGPDIGLYCAFGALVLAVAGVVIAGIRDWRGLVAETGHGGTGTAGQAAGTTPGATTAPPPRAPRAGLDADLPPGEPWSAEVAAGEPWTGEAAAADGPADGRARRDGVTWRTGGGASPGSGERNGESSGFAHGIVVAPIDPFMPPPTGRH